ncbi:alpha/beta fold hydrolase [Nocardioides sp. NPDC006303]|uniref:alpha/beta fold hydrolase n=1 Tax=Nocardioides sp. NPDC006303 TaxID=3156747 RepID=UPI0033BDDA78
MKKIQLSGADIAVSDQGRGETPVVLLHGFLCSSDMWRHQVAELASTTRTLTLDFPGHGESRALTTDYPFTEDGFADLTASLLERLGISSAVLVGFSMGGGVALNVAARYPRLVAGLFLADVGGGSVDVEEHRASMHRVADRIDNGEFSAAVEDFLVSPTFVDYVNRSADCRSHMETMMLGCDPSRISSVLRGVLAGRAPISERPVEDIKVPTHVLVGALDQQCRLPASELFNRIPGAAFTSLADAGHMTPVEEPEAFTGELRQFLRRM